MTAGVYSLMANITRTSLLRFPIPACHSRRSLMATDPFGTTGWHGGRIARRFSSTEGLIRPLFRSPCSPACTWGPLSLWVPSHSSVEPFFGVIVVRGTFTTSANGCVGWSKSASECTGCDVGGVSSVGGIAVFPEQKVHLGRGPNMVEVPCVTMGSLFIIILNRF